jgi:hypothetical protein
MVGAFSVPARGVPQPNGLITLVTLITLRDNHNNPNDPNQCRSRAFWLIQRNAVGVSDTL